MTTRLIDDKEKDIIRRFKILLIDDEDEEDIFPVTMERLQLALEEFKDNEHVREYIIRSIGYEGEPEDDETLRHDFRMSQSDFKDLKDKVFVRLSTPMKMSILTGRIFKSDYL